MKTTKKTSRPTMWLFQATEDYSSSRCLFLSGLSGGFMLAQQALEKLLKAHLTIAHPDHSKFIGPQGLAPKVLDVAAGHDLVAHLRLAEKQFPHLALDPGQLELITNLSYCFHSKYPDVETPLESRTTAWLDEIDRIFVRWSLGLPLLEEARWRTGLHTCVWCEVLGTPVHPPVHWIRTQNKAFAEVHDRLRADVETHSRRKRENPELYAAAIR
ncbi:hypothetical protein [Acidovorax sp. HMWF018]|uniref:hypothetical protein n=1 Tax=Acidovorax sp. HMWF018 TaxID=2056855 RepID=UPI0011B22120|nr:hypothetical protein [Acidovorax sp. HMWF018]